MKKIAILSFINTKNYGGLLQAFALQNFLKSNGCEAFHINYKAPETITGNPAKRFLRKIYKRISFLFFDKKRHENEKKFRAKISLSTPCTVKEDIAKIPCDYFIVGSDQVWNPFLNNFDDAYLLSFETSARKVAFSASLGLTQRCPSNWKNELKSALPQFSFVSVRERTAKNLLCDLGGTNIVVSLDPTFLLTKNEWLDATKDFDSSVIPTKPFVLCYVMPGDTCLVKSMLKFARQIAKRERLRLCVIGLRDVNRLKFNSSFTFGAGPSEFVHLVSKSSYVITNSFHGTVFSTIFNKPFASFISKNGSSSSLSERIVDFLGEFDLTDRLMTEQSDFSQTPINQQMNANYFAKINQRINETKKILLGSVGQNENNLFLV